MSTTEFNNSFPGLLPAAVTLCDFLRCAGGPHDGHAIRSVFLEVSRRGEQLITRIALVGGTGLAVMEANEFRTEGTVTELHSEHILMFQCSEVIADHSW